MSIERLVDYFKKQDLSGDDILKMIGRPPILYSDLQKYKSLREMLTPKQPYAVILYQTSSKTDGHYVCIFIRQNKIYFQDSYGLKPDTEQQYAAYDKKLPRYLTELIESDGRELVYNTFDYQAKSSSVATCGRWSCIRILLCDLENEQFKHVFYNNKVPYLTPDNIVVMLTLTGLNNIQEYFDKN